MNKSSIQRLIVKGTTDKLPDAAKGSTGSKTSELWAAVAAECRSKTGQWVMFEIPGRSSKSLQSSRTHIKSGKTHAFKRGSWDAAIRGDVLYVKHIGDDTAEVVNFKKGQVA